MSTSSLIIGVSGNSQDKNEDLKLRLSKMPLKFLDGDHHLDDDEVNSLNLAHNYMGMLEMRNIGVIAFNNRLKKACKEAFKNGINIVEGGIISFSAEGLESLYEKMEDNMIDRGFILKFNEINDNFEVTSGKFILEESARKLREMQMQKMQHAQRMQEMLGMNKRG